MMIKFCFSNLSKLKLYGPPKPQEPYKTIRPFQHPTDPLTKQLDILQPMKPERFLMENYETPRSLYLMHGQENSAKALSDRVADQLVQKKVAPIDIKEQKFLCVSLVGPPNSGKSTLLNHFVGEPISAVSNKRNTTSSSIHGVYSDIESGTQIEFIDTPGTFSRFKFSKRFTTRGWDSIDESNLCIVMLDAVKTLDIHARAAMKRLDEIKVDQKLLRLSQQPYDEQLNLSEIPKPGVETPLPKVLVLNKMDLCFNKRKLKWLLAEMEDLTHFDKVFYVSSLTGFGIPELKSYLIEQSFHCKWKYDQNQKHTNTPVDQLEQIARQAIFKRFYYELPYIIGVNIKEFRVTNKANAQAVFQINVQTMTQAKIVIGEDGRTVKQLCQEIEKQLVQAFKKLLKVKLQVTIKEGDKQVEFESEKEGHKHHTLVRPDQLKEEAKQRRETVNEKIREYLTI